MGEFVMRDRLPVSNAAAPSFEAPVSDTGDDLAFMRQCGQGARLRLADAEWIASRTMTAAAPAGFPDHDILDLQGPISDDAVTTITMTRDRGRRSSDAVPTVRWPAASLPPAAGPEPLAPASDERFAEPTSTGDRTGTGNGAFDYHAWSREIDDLLRRPYPVAAEPGATLPADTHQQDLVGSNGDRGDLPRVLSAGVLSAGVLSAGPTIKSSEGVASVPAPIDRRGNAAGTSRRLGIRRGRSSLHYGIAIGSSALTMVGVIGCGAYGLAQPQAKDTLFAAGATLLNRLQIALR